MSRWYIKCKAKDPADLLSGIWQVGVTQRKFDMLRTYGHEVKLARLALVEQVLLQPHLLIRGWSRPDKDDCFAYVGLPDKDFKSLTIETGPPPSCFFIAFVLADGTIDDWTWRPCDESDPKRPSGFNGEVIWP